MRRFYLTVILALTGALLLIQPTSAPGAMRFAAPDGNVTACSQSAPCSLETALSQSVDGDTVYARWGVYTSATVIGFDHNITLIGRWDGGTGPAVGRLLQADATILDGENQRRVVYIIGNVAPTLDGITIQGGRASEGAGVAVYAGASATLTDVIVRNNVATAGWGGGVQVDNSTLLIQHSQIINNSTSNGGGGVAAAWGSQVTLHNNLIANNSAGENGAGVRLRDVTATLTNNTIVGGQGVGAEGIYASEQEAVTTLTLTNNIITGQTYGVRFGGSLAGVATISYNDVWGNTTANYSGLADPTGADGNISADPLFVNGPSRWAGGWDFAGYYLSQTAAGQPVTSPAMDAGSGSASQMNLAARTTRSDSQVDSGVVDMGFHYPLFYPVFLPICIKQ